MPFDTNHLQKPFRKLIKIAKPSARLADPERVHKLRTNTRRIEAVLNALDLPQPRRRKTLLKELKKIRRSAGEVRDMDVLTAKAADVALNNERACQVQLLEHLGVERHRQAKRLTLKLKRHGKQARRILAGFADEVESRAARPPIAATMEEETKIGVARETEKLQKFATLNRNNLHEFRKAGKQLRYVIQIAKPRDEAFVKALGDMQTAIGEWHDWEELLGIARVVLRHGDKCALLGELQLHADEAFDAALKNANAVRRRYFHRGPRAVPLRVVPRAA